MKAAVFTIVTLVAFSGMAFAEEEVCICEIANQIKSAFNEEEGTFAEGAYTILTEALPMIEQCLEQCGKNPADVYALYTMKSLVMYNLACYEAIDNNTEEAFTWLEGAIDSGFSDPDWMLEDADLESLREDARFENLLQKAEENREKVVEYESVYGYNCEDTCGETSGGCCEDSCN